MTTSCICSVFGHGPTAKRQQSRSRTRNCINQDKVNIFLFSWWGTQQTSHITKYRFTMALESFHRMMDLPLEIRHEIYLLATPDRVVHTRLPYPTPGIRIGRSSYSTHIPPLLQTCYESRNVLKRTGYGLNFQITPTGRQVWFNFKRDTLFIDKGRDTGLDGPRHQSVPPRRYP
jgi:hypothetical protein